MPWATLKKEYVDPMVGISVGTPWVVGTAISEIFVDYEFDRIH